MPPPLIVAIHGILTRQTVASWPDYLDVFMRDTKVVKREYVAGPFPVWNMFVKNRFLARALAAEVELFVGWRVSFVAHSNGCDVAIRTMRELAKRGIAMDTVILTGSVTQPNVRKNGILDLMEAGMLERAIAYCSEGDLPLRLPFSWPYSDLGRRGWADVPRHLEDRIITRWFPGAGHSGYFSPANREATFQMIAEDLLRVAQAVVENCPRA